MYWVCKKSDHSVVLFDHGTRFPQFSQEYIVNEAVHAFGGVPSDYASMLTNDGDIHDRIEIYGDAYELVWDGDDIVAVSFAPEEAKRIIDLVASKSIVLNNGLHDTVSLTGTVYLADGETVDTSFNGALAIPIRTPPRPFKLYAKFTNGVCTYTYAPNEHDESTGTYIMPTSKHLGDNNEFRVRKVAKFEIMIPVGYV